MSAWEYIIMFVEILKNLRKESKGGEFDKAESNVIENVKQFYCNVQIVKRN